MPQTLFVVSDLSVILSTYLYFTLWAGFVKLLTRASSSSLLQQEGQSHRQIGDWKYFGRLCYISIMFFLHIKQNPLEKKNRVNVERYPCPTSTAVLNSSLLLSFIWTAKRCSIALNKFAVILAFRRNPAFFIPSKNGTDSADIEGTFQKVFEDRLFSLFKMTDDW